MQARLHSLECTRPAKDNTRELLREARRKVLWLIVRRKQQEEIEMERGASVYKPVASWDTDDVIAWIRGLGECLSPHISQFQAHCICGSDLLKLNKQQLEYLKVTQMGHQELLLEAVERLSALDLSCSQNPTMNLVSTLSKKTSQLITTLDPSHKNARKPHPHPDGSIELSQVDIAADVMTSSRSLINWLDRNPTNLVLDYNEFRQTILKDTLELSIIPQETEFDKQKMSDACRRILKQTQVLMSPQNFQAVEPIKLHIIPLTPSPEAGLGVSLRRTKQGNLIVNGIRPDSPAAMCGTMIVGDELVQINRQNVVGWEVAPVVQLLKASGHNIVMVMKAGLLHTQQEKQELECIDGENGFRNSQTQSTSEITADEESCDSLDCLADSSTTSLERLQRASLSPGSDSDISSPGSIPDAHKNLQRALSNPLIDGERSKSTAGAVGGVRRLSDSAELEETDLGDPLKRKRVPSYEALLQRRTESDPHKLKDADQQKPMPQVAYRTQVVGGVVMRIPIKPEEQASPKLKKTGSGGKKPVKGKKHNMPTLQSPVDGDVDKGKGKVVFHDPREIVVDGQATKQITLTSTGEPQYTSKDASSGHKKSNPALHIPCFQLKDVDHEGWMNKMGGSGLTPKNWRRRWFVLKSGKLYYYKTSFDVTATGIVDLVGYNIEAATDTKKKNCLKATQDGMRTYYFQTDTSEQMLLWMQKLSGACKAATASSSRPSQSIDEAQSEDELSN